MSADADPIDTFTPPVRLRVRTKLNVRAAPTRSARLVARREPEEILLADQLLEAEDYLDESHWYRLAQGNAYVWAGGVAREQTAPQLPQLVVEPVVKRRADGTIAPRTLDELTARYGKFDYTDNADGSISIAGSWESQHIVEFTHPLLNRFRQQKLRVHQLAWQAFTDVFNAIDAARAGECLLTCAGTFVPRHITWNVKKPLSSHSFGIAIDINAEWNGYGSRPTALGLRGTVLPLVPIFNHYGFAWGGHFRGTSVDGMHFELAVG